MRALLWTFGVLFACGLCMPRGAPERAPLRLQRQQDASAALERARAAKTAMRGLEGAALKRARRRAVAAYRRVRREHPGSVEAAEAAFRAGELLRAAEDVQGARREFQAAAEGGAPKFRARATLELAHLERRAGHLERALTLFEAVALDEHAPAHLRDAAGLGCARVLLAHARTPEARRWAARVARTARDPLVRIHAHDVIACAWVDAGDLEAAAGALEECRAALQSIAREETALGGRVRAALEERLAVERLRTAVAERWRRKQ